MVKDRLQEMNSMGDEKNPFNTTTDPLLDDSVDTSPLLPIDTFLAEVASINEKVKQYDENISKMEDLQGKLLVGLAWGQDARATIAQDLDIIVAENKAIASNVTKRIKAAFTTTDSTEQEEEIKRRQLASLVTSLNKAVMKAKNSEVQYKNQTKKKLVNAIKISGAKGLSEEEIDEKIDNDDIESFLSGSIIQETDEAKRQLGEVQDRHKELKKLEDDITELSELYQEMMELVESQGVVLNRVETKVEESQDRVRLGVEGLRVAREMFDKAWKKKTILAVGLAVLLVILVIIVASSAGSGGPSPPIDPTPTPSPSPPTSPPTSTTTVNYNLGPGK